jgi:tryptophan-rich sensory protein
MPSAYVITVISGYFCWVISEKDNNVNTAAGFVMLILSVFLFSDLFGYLACIGQNEIPSLMDI